MASGTVSVMERARANIVLDHAFFAAILLKYPMKEDLGIKHMVINPATCEIRYNPRWTDTLTVKQCIFALAEQVLHYVGRDSLRVGSRDKKKWNKVANKWIRDFLHEAGIGELLPQTPVFPGASKDTREHLYDIEVEEEGNGGGGGNQPPQGGGGDGGGSGKSQQPKPEDGDGDGESEGESEPQPGDGDGDDPLGNDIDYSGVDRMTEAEKSEAECNAIQDTSQAAQAAKARGNMSGALQKLVQQLIETHTPWYEILERHMVEKVQVETSWARPNRRYAPDFYMPVRDNEGTMGEMVIQIDVSGSVSAKELKHYQGHMQRIAELTKPSKVHVLYTDTSVLKHEEYENPEDLTINFMSGGGTRMEAGFEYLAKKGIEPAVMVTLTDGYDSYDPKNAPDYPVIWCISGENRTAPYGENIHFDLND